MAGRAGRVILGLSMELEAGLVIPLVIFGGLMFGRRWAPTLIGGALLWSIFTGLMSVFDPVGTFGWGPVLGAAALGAANAALGVGIRRMFRGIALYLRVAVAARVRGA